MYPKVVPSFRDRVEGTMERKHLEDYNIKALFPMDEALVTDQLNGMLTFILDHSLEKYVNISSIGEGNIVTSVSNKSYIVESSFNKFLITSYLDSIEVVHTDRSGERTAYYYKRVLDPSSSATPNNELNITFVGNQLKTFFVALLTEYYERSVYHDRMGL